MAVLNLNERPCEIGGEVRKGSDGCGRGGSGVDIR
jgi:hypothetical protein